MLQNSLGLLKLVPDVDRKEDYKNFGTRMKIWDHGVVTGRCTANRGSDATVNDTTPGDGEPEAAENESSSEMEVCIAFLSCTT